MLLFKRLGCFRKYANPGQDVSGMNCTNDHTTSGTGRCMVCLMKKASTLVTYSEGGPVPAVLPFIRLWHSLRILSCNTETAHKISPSISPSFNSIASPLTQRTQCSSVQRLPLAYTLPFKYSFPVAQLVEHGVSNAKIMGSIPRESKS